MQLLLTLFVYDLARQRNFLHITYPRLGVLTGLLENPTINKTTPFGGALWARGLSLTWFYPDKGRTHTLLSKFSSRDFFLVFDRQFTKFKTPASLCKRSTTLIFPCIQRSPLLLDWKSFSFTREHGTWGGGFSSMFTVWGGLILTTLSRSNKKGPVSRLEIDFSLVPKQTLFTIWAESLWPAHLAIDVADPVQPPLTWGLVIPEEPLFQTPALVWEELEDAPCLSVFDYGLTVAGFAETCRLLLPINCVLHSQVGSLYVDSTFLLVTASTLFKRQVMNLQSVSVGTGSLFFSAHRGVFLLCVI